MKGTIAIFKNMYDYIRQKLCFLPDAVLFLDLILVTILYVFVIVYLPTQNGDNIEHIHSSFLIAQGQVPYRDFFQHHNPLLWYLFAPVTKFFAYNTTVVEILCFISLLVFLKSLVYVYRIGAEFLSNKFWALVGAAMVATPGYKVYAIDFRPDNYMMFCFIGGLYYLFSYLRDKRTMQIAVAFLWFFVSFLFAQKVIFSLIVLGGWILYLWYKKDIATKDILVACVLPFVGVLGGVFYLYHYDMIKLYYLCNYTFNLNLVEGFEFGRIAPMPTFVIIFVGLGFLGGCIAFWGNNRYLKIIAILFFSEFIQRRFYFSPYSYYYWLLLYFAAFCATSMLCKLDRMTCWGRILFVALLYYFLYQSAIFYKYLGENVAEQPYLPNYITQRISPCDYVFNGDGFMYNLFAKDPAYYWQLIGQLDVVGEKTGLEKRPDINALILALKPKFIYGDSYFDKFSKEQGKQRIVHYVDKEIVNKYYDLLPLWRVYQLKPEYDNRLCVKDYRTNQWSYQD